MNSKILTYHEVQDQIIKSQGKKFLLTGNGFSMSYSKDRFSFTSLLDNAVKNSIIKNNSPVHKIFSHLNTCDFEEVIKLLETSIHVITEYSQNDSEIKDKISNDARKLKEHLVEVITNNHPEKITEISDDKFLRTAKFISYYDSVYTLNYDLLLYWTTIKLNEFSTKGEIVKSTLKINDGFSSSFGSGPWVSYDLNSHQSNIFYLHGALHIFDRGSEIIKTTFSRTQECLKEQTLRYINNNIYPIFVSEGTSEQKLTKIIHNRYLDHCYRSLFGIGSKKGRDNMVILGTLLKSNDNHIQEAILNNNVSNIYFGVGNEDEQVALQTFVKKLEKKQKKCCFYDYKTVEIW